MLTRIRHGVARHGVTAGGIRLLDHWLNPLGISPLSLLGLGISQGPEADPAQEHFDAIAEGQTWGSEESISGPGSEISYTAPYRRALVDALQKYKIRSVFDAPCGDLNWMTHVLNVVNVEYSGGDISPVVIASNRRQHPDIRTFVFDITRQAFPQAQVWHCRDCMFHLSYKDIMAALHNFVNSDCEYALLTSHTGLIRNYNIRTGGWRYLDLRKAPFNFGKAEAQLIDYRKGIDFPRYVGLWRRDVVAQYLEIIKVGDS